jgi:cytochrome c-type biogenesis protein CcmI
MLFWSSVVLITLATLWTVVGPLLRSHRPRDDHGADPLIAVYRDRRREIDEERIAGRLSDDEARIAIEELVAQMAIELPAQTSRSAAEAGPPAMAKRLLALVLAVLIPAARYARTDRSRHRRRPERATPLRRSPGRPTDHSGRSAGQGQSQRRRSLAGTRERSQVPRGSWRRGRGV